jgi:hypothetical protein
MTILLVPPDGPMPPGVEEISPAEAAYGNVGRLTRKRFSTLCADVQ